MIFRRRIVPLLLVVVVTAGLLVALRHARETWSAVDREKQSLAQAVQTLTAEHSRLRHEIAGSDATVADGSTTEPAVILELRAALASIVAGRKSNPLSPPAGQPYPRSTRGDIFPELLADSEYLHHTMAYQRWMIEVRYADFFAMTTARPEAVEKLRSALLQHSIADLEREELIAKHGVPASELGELAHLLRQKLETEAREILGETGYAEFQRHERTIPQRRVVAAFAERLSYADEPLDRAQAAALVAILAAATEPFGNRQIPARKFTEDVIARTNPVLSAAQREELRRFQRELDAAERR